MKTTRLTVPFAHFRAFLPADGVRIEVWRGRKRWPKNKTAFMQYETAEISFGRAIRAQEDHRDRERSLSPGILCHPGSIEVRGGWAAHKHVPVHNDFFDGEFNAHLLLSMDRGRLQCEMRDLRMTWNASFVAKLVDFTGLVRAHVIRLVQADVQDRINAEITRQIDAAMKDLTRRVPQAQVAKDRTSIALHADAMEIILHYQQPIIQAANATRLRGAEVQSNVKNPRVATKAGKQVVKPVSKAAISKGVANAKAKAMSATTIKRTIKSVR
ncbi:hypothetical protein E2F46_02735 [Luteimonas aestuarii]|uniref:Uncharacterized protein n=1 Tax=Luteimonas aestuarii TaxID=453837 RepID=A0A4R5U0S6_9GAMM|nr:hypothetical protein [Luteimonas aestuarii]TDK27147.1 hypothetical protein E2F46_02735 [Luteimonas aestuarii]